MKALAVGLCLFSTSVFAHDIDCGGKGIMPEVKASCCGPADAHRSDAAHVYQKADNHWYFLASDGKEWPIANGNLTKGGGIMPSGIEPIWIEPLPISHDSCYWVWYNGGTTVGWFTFYCLQIPSGV